jgi:hypothetical protein
LVRFNSHDCGEAYFHVADRPNALIAGYLDLDYFPRGGLIQLHK